MGFLKKTKAKLEDEWKACKIKRGMNFSQWSSIKLNVIMQS